jgi:hypothetical protein
MLLLHIITMSRLSSGFLLFFMYRTTSSTITSSEACFPNSSTANAIQNQVPEFFVRNSFDDGTLHMQGWHELEGEQVLAQTRRAVRTSTVATFSKKIDKNSSNTEDWELSEDRTKVELSPWPRTKCRERCEGIDTTLVMDSGVSNSPKAPSTHTESLLRAGLPLQ